MRHFSEQTLQLCIFIRIKIHATEHSAANSSLEEAEFLVDPGHIELCHHDQYAEETTRFTSRVYM